MKKIGLIINPIAGMGGRVGLKGTDGVEILQRAKALGAKPAAEERTMTALRPLIAMQDKIKIFTYPAQMGENSVRRVGLQPQVIGELSSSVTTAADSQTAAEQMVQNGVDLLLFTGGDGTARDIYQAIGDSPVVLGIPAGVKIHSAVFAVNPAKAGEVAAAYLLGKIRQTVAAEVMDLDEKNYRQGIVTARLFGYMRIPLQRRFMQSGKSPSPANEKYLQQAIAAAVVEKMSDEYCYVVGPGTTTKAIFEKLGLEFSLLGVDLIEKKKLIAKDVNENDLLKKLRGHKAKVVVTPIGGQGFLFGRGNLQISPNVITEVGKENIIIIATQQKINALNGRPLLTDTGNAETDEYLHGYYRIITGYREEIVYRVGSDKSD